MHYSSSDLAPLPVGQTVHLGAEVTVFPCSGCRPISHMLDLLFNPKEIEKLEALRGARWNRPSCEAGARSTKVVSLANTGTFVKKLPYT